MINQYIPKVIVAGESSSFFASISSACKPAVVIGSMSFSGELEDKKYELSQNTLLLDNKIIDIEEIKKLNSEGKFDYVVFVDYLYFSIYAPLFARLSGVHIDQILMIDTFIDKVYNGFFSGFNEMIIFDLLVKEKINTVLDADSYFTNGKIHVKPQELSNVKIEGIRSEVYNKYPIYENFYNHVYNSLKDCHLHYYDAIILSAEQTAEDTMIRVREMLNQTKLFFVFVRTEVDFNRFLAIVAGGNIFTSIRVVPSVNGKWVIFSKDKPETAKIYIVTHKKFEVKNIPDDYITIHAGRKNNEDLGYIGDDTGQSISELNPYLNEMTAAYWIWKNVSHDYVGLVHYRRFFSNQNSKEFKPENILTVNEAKDILKDYDIILAKEEVHLFNSHNYMVNDTGKFIAHIAINLARTILERHFPDYVEAFDYVISGTSLFKCNMFITRKYIFDSYCSWLFSFILEAESSFRKYVNIDELNFKQKRVYGFICERMFNVWIIKNHLRIKDLMIMENI